ncbi:MAG: hypothetical protein LUF68_01335 [Clostridiales bacterium]|nr:hypothetical protein [Clostridiales bacterium]
MGDFIQESNPAEDSIHTWVRSAEEIKTFQETLNDPDWSNGSDFAPDYTWEMAQEAAERGKIRVYSSDPISPGAFVTPSRMEAKSYSGNGSVHEKTVKLTDVAWIDPTQGQYTGADSSQPPTNDPDIRFSRRGKQAAGNVSSDALEQARAEARALQKENDRLKERLEKAKGQVKRTTAAQRGVRSEDTRRLARSLVKEYGSQADVQTVADSLKALGDYLVQEDNVAFTLEIDVVKKL